METFGPHDLVTVSTGGPPIDGIVVEHVSAHKVVVALVDAQRGPVFRTLAPEALTAREDAGPADPVLGQLIRRSPNTARGGAKGARGGVRGGNPGHSRVAGHRKTGG